MKPVPVSAKPWRALAVLTLVVLWVHGLLLQARPGGFAIGWPSTPRALVTRAVTPETPPAPLTPADMLPKAEVQPPPTAPPAPTPAPADTSTMPVTPVPAGPPREPAPQAEQASEVSAPSTASADAQALTSQFTVPGSAFMRYKVSGQAQQRPYTGNAALNWRNDGTQYVASLEVTTPQGSRVSQSSGTIGPDGLAPDVYRERVPDGPATRFDWTQGLLAFGNNAASVALQRGAQDPLSLWFQLGTLLNAKDAAQREGASLLVQTIGTADTGLGVFEVMGAETMVLPQGETQVIKLQRDPGPGHPQRWELWLAPTQDYVPLRVRITEPDGDFVDFQWLETPQA